MTQRTALWIVAGILLFVIWPQMFLIVAIGAIFYTIFRRQQRS